MEREVGGGIRTGNTCKPMAVSVQCMTKSTTNKKNLKKEERECKLLSPLTHMKIKSSHSVRFLVALF